MRLSPRNSIISQVYRGLGCCVDSVGESVNDIGNVTLISGGQVYAGDVEFNPDSYHFRWEGLDITNDLYRADKKRLIPGFSDEKDNSRLSWEHQHGQTVSVNDTVLPTGTGGILWDQIITNPLDAPIDALNSGVNKVLSSSGAWTIGLMGLGLFALAVFALREGTSAYVKIRQ